MRTPFENNFQLDTFELTQVLFDRGYLILSDIPEHATISLIVEEQNDILSSYYNVFQVTSENIFLFPDAEVGKYVLAWDETLASSSSSSSAEISELRGILEANIGDIIQVRYISNN